MPTLGGIIRAAKILARFQPATPLYQSRLLSDIAGADVWIKQETASPVASFKWRGAINAVAAEISKRPLKQVVTASSGNHGLGVTFASRHFGLPVRVYVPADCEPAKRSFLEQLGADVISVDGDIDDAKDASIELARCDPTAFVVDDGSDCRIVEGAGTIGLEIAYNLDDVDTIFVPMGSGSLAAGIAIAAKSMQPEISIVAVQSENGRAMVDSFHAREALERPVETLADCLTCRYPVPMALRTLIENVDDAICVTDRQILKAMKAMICTGRLLVEPGAAAGLAACMENRTRWAGKKIVLVATGSNTSASMIGRAMQEDTYALV